VTSSVHSAHINEKKSSINRTRFYPAWDFTTVVGSTLMRESLLFPFLDAKKKKKRKKETRPSSPKEIPQVSLRDVL